LLSALLISATIPSSRADIAAETLAHRPPLGWNSWDCFGSDLNEEQFKANVDFMATRLRQYGWEYVVIDLGWYLDPALNVVTFKAKRPPQTMDQYGRLVPDVRKFPSSAGGAGFKPLADYVHSKGLKFGIHIMRGIPWEAVEKRLPIKGTRHTADEIADFQRLCPWYDGMRGVDTNKPGAQAYYDSIVELYSEWGVDFIKADDMTRRDYHRGEITALHQALKRSPRPIVLSLSPGPTPIEELEHLRQSAQMWRVSSDFWDDWKFVVTSFELARAWQGKARPGAWPDYDMLPFGKLRVTGSDDYVANHLNTTSDKITNEYSRFTDEEKKTVMTLWCIGRSPLMFGGHLPETDEFSLSLITNEDALRVNQYSEGNRELRYDGFSSVWVARDQESGDHYVALFNLTSEPRRVSFAASEVGIKGRADFKEVWTGARSSGRRVQSVVPARGARLYRVAP
jgi:hypothetical protein